MVKSSDYTLIQNGRHFSILLFPCKLSLMASFKVKYSFELYVGKRGHKGNLHGNKEYYNVGHFGIRCIYK